MFFKKEQKVKNEEAMALIGKIFIAIGFIDIIFMFYSFSQGINYSSSLNIFAIIAGVYLLKGSFKAVRFISFFAGLYVGVIILGALTVAIIFPVSYWLALLKMNFISFSIQLVFNAVTIIFLIWAYVKLTNKKMTEEMIKKGFKFDKPWKKQSTGIVIGILIGIIFSSFTYFMLRGESAKIAIEKAKQQYGLEYSYVVRSLSVNISNGQKTGVAVVAIYNKEEMRNIAIEF